MKINSIEGRSGFLVEREAELTNTTSSFGGGFALITQKGAVSYFDTLKDDSVEGGEALPVGCPVWLDAWATQEKCPLKEGDACMPWDMRISCWTTDCPDSAQEGEVDLTSQCNRIAGEKEIVGDGNVTETGTINGFYDSRNEMQAAITGLFHDRVIHDGSKVTYVPRQKDQVFWHFFKYREMREVGEIERTIIRRMRISQFTAGQGASGGVPFNFNYTALKTWRYEKVVS